MRILVCIAYYGTRNEAYVRELIDEYRSMRFDVDIVVVSEAPKELPAGVEVRVGLPSSNPWSLPFAHKPLFAQHQDDYDLFVYTEDDTLMRERNIDAFLQATSVLEPTQVPGFIRSEAPAEGPLRCSSQHSFYHWQPGSAFRASDGSAFGRFTNDHGACYVLTREQLKHCLDSGGFLTPPREGEYDMLVTAATDPYTVCGLRRVMSLDRLDDFTLPHLTNKYTDKLGLSFDEVKRQVACLKESIDDPSLRRSMLTEREASLAPRWRKHYYEPAAAKVLDELPSQPSSVLSIGAGIGDLELAISSQGHEVTAIPLDSIIGRSCQAKGTAITSPDLDAALTELSGRTFDAIVISDLLTRQPDPVGFVQRLVPFAHTDTNVLVMSPNVLRARLQQARRRDNTAIPASYARDGLHPGSPRRIRQILSRAGFSETRGVGLGSRKRGVPGTEWFTHRQFLIVASAR